MRRRHGTEASSPWYRAAVILEPFRWQDSICQCRRYAADTPSKAKGGAADKVLPSAAADTWQAIASVDNAPSSGRHARRDAAWNFSGLVQRSVELVLGNLHAVHPGSGCGQKIS